MTARIHENLPSRICWADLLVLFFSFPLFFNHTQCLKSLVFKKLEKKEKSSKYARASFYKMVEKKHVKSQHVYGSSQPEVILFKVKDRRILVL